MLSHFGLSLVTGSPSGVSSSFFFSHLPRENKSNRKKFPSLSSDSHSQCLRHLLDFRNTLQSIKKEDAWSWYSLLKLLGKVALFEKKYFVISWIIQSDDTVICLELKLDTVCGPALQDVQCFPGLSIYPDIGKCRSMNWEEIGRRLKWSSICIWWKSSDFSHRQKTWVLSMRVNFRTWEDFFFLKGPHYRDKNISRFGPKEQSCFMLCDWDAYLISAQWRGQESARLLKLIGPCCCRSPV